ncbi:AAA domain-containing protein [Prolixibacter denitrificans]|uniref:AAA domain-containing protein n=2 Tax=Prolixibacter denitrificans TaxID=1541063 RepID=A0A2P8CHN9_9BACT|nr:AAA domain-containing protein [Prolixibacter denitrificans]GET20662.1 hypothetical protein JCM18694_09080 [Prolixibacter denitrificans]
MELRKAKRSEATIKMALQGPSGSGKTYSSLLIANGLLSDWRKIAIVDTENHSAHLYSHLGNYNVLSLEKPFSPERYIEAISMCENAGMEVIIIDSISHEWEGQGGILDIHGNMVGNSFTNWSKVTPRHNAFVQKILQSPSHIIGTIRTKQDYVISEKNGKHVPEKVGLKGITRDGLDYEFTIVFDLDVRHHATASKDRTGLFMDKPQFMINNYTGKKIMNWCNPGENKDEIINQINTAKSVDELRKIYLAYPLYQKELEERFLYRKNELTANTKIEEHGANSSQSL